MPTLNDVSLGSTPAAAIVRSLTTSNDVAGPSSPAATVANLSPFDTETASPGASSSPSSSLSDETKIAIGVSVPLVVIFLLGGICLFFRCRRRRLRPRVRHDLSAALPTNYTARTWDSSSHSGSQSQLMPVSKHSNSSSKISEIDPPKYLQVPVPEKDGIRRGTGDVKIKYDRGEELVELADTSPGSVKRWNSSSISRSNSEATSNASSWTYEKKKSAEQRSWFEEGPPSPELKIPMRARLE